MHTIKNYGGLDRFRMAAALLVITIHTSPLASVNESADFFLTRVLARVAVPFFFMVTGHFVAADFWDSEDKKPLESSSRKTLSGKKAASGASALQKFLKKTVPLYLFCILLYLPLGIYAEHFRDLTPGAALRMLVFDGSFYHLWYFPACILGVLLIYLLSRFLSLRAVTAVSAVLYTVGLLGDSYYGLVQKVPFLETVYEFLFQISSRTRNGLFMAPVFLVMGARAGLKAAKRKTPADRQDFMSDCMGLVFSFAIMCGEAFLLRHLDFQRHDSMYLLLIPVMFFLYQCLLSLNRNSLRSFRIASAWIYILHPAFIAAVHAAAKRLEIPAAENSVLNYLVVTLVSVAAAFLIAFVRLRFPLRSLTNRKNRTREIENICSFIEREEQERAIVDLEAEDCQDAPEEILLEDSPAYDPESPSEDIAADNLEILSESALETVSAGGPKFPPKGASAGDANPSSEAGSPGGSKFPPKGASAINTKIPSKCMPEKRQSFSQNLPGKRAWIELDQSALQQNVDFLCSLLPERCRLMPAVKADAYGHGGVLISRLLADMGVDAFCVACLAEAISLREAGIKGEILILGYTSPENFSLIHRYHLTQAIVDYNYAQLMNRFGSTLHAHLAIDTGMHRLGIRCENLEEIQAVYEMTNLSVDGIFTHLSVSDSLLPQDMQFTAAQIQAFYQVIRILKKQGCPCRGLHLLASYGILNMLASGNNLPASPEADKTPELKAAEQKYAASGILKSSHLAANYVRPGIALYGVLSNKADSTAWRNFLQPVLSLKAKVSSVRPLYTGEATGYGAAFTAKRDMRIATISIGYADGLPRALSHGKGSVLINGYRAPILGRICMDQTIVDVSRIPRIQAGDTAVIIGRSGSLENTADNLAAQCDTITNELLSRLGGRLERVIKS